jgi:hypothetical protein
VLWYRLVSRSVRSLPTEPERAFSALFHLPPASQDLYVVMVAQQLLALSRIHNMSTLSLTLQDKVKKVA